jgi:hypothetical protein
VILIACLTVYVGCYRSVKPTPPSVSITFPFCYPHVSADITVTGKLQQIFDLFYVTCYTGDDVQGTCYAVPFSGKCYAFVIVPSIQVSLKRLGQCCADCVLFYSWHCCSLVSPNILEQLFCKNVNTSHCLKKNMQTLSVVPMN